MNFQTSKLSSNFALACVCLVALSGCLGAGGFGDQSSVATNPDTTTPNLPQPPTNPPEKVAAASSEVMLQVGNRRFVESVLKVVFLSPTASSDARTKFRTVLDDSVQKFPGEFGGPLVLYSTTGLKEMKDTSISCGNSTCTNEDMLNIQYMVTATPARSSVMAEACQKLLDSTAAPVSDSFLLTAIANLGGNVANEPSDELLSQIPDLFSPGIEVSPELTQATLQVKEALKVRSLNAREQWRGVLQVHCQNPYWHAL